MIKPFMSRPLWKSKKTVVKRSLALPLTSLIDAFSIIVFYLLVATQTVGIDQSVPQDLDLPKLTEIEFILQEEPILVKVTEHSYSLNEQKVSERDLTKALITEVSLRKAASLPINILIQADRKQSFERLNPILEAASLAQINELKFAVLPELNPRVVRHARASTAKGY
jgi:biopolymer transport protein ExbD